MAKLLSCLSSNSARCLSFITPNTVSRVCSGDNGVLVTGTILPFTFMLGGTPAVINRSEAPFSTISFSNRSNSMAIPCSLVQLLSGFIRERERLEVFRQFGFGSCTFAGDQAPLQQAQQALVEGLHANRSTGLDR